MRKLILFCASLFALAFVVLARPANAQTILWVGPSGIDTNSCSQTAPCATFAGALGKGATQINCLGSGNYGQLNSNTAFISGSIIIDCGAGNIGEMTTSGTLPAIEINGSGATVVLRHLNLNGGGKNASGIANVNFSGTLIIENCMIHDFGQDGVLFAPTSGRGTLQVSDSLIYNNGQAAILIGPDSGQIASVTLNRDELTANGTHGLLLQGNGVVAGTMRETLVSQNHFNGVSASTTQVFFTVEGSSIIDNLSFGILTTSPGAIIDVGGTTIGGNGTGVNPSAGSIISFGNNQMSANGVNGTFTGTTPLQ
jgi:hypothetical protein